MATAIAAGTAQVLTIEPADFYSLDEALERLARFVGQRAGLARAGRASCRRSCAASVFRRSALAATFAATLELARSRAASNCARTGRSGRSTCAARPGRAHARAGMSERGAAVAAARGAAVRRAGAAWRGGVWRGSSATRPMSRRCCASWPRAMPGAASIWSRLAGGWTFPHRARPRRRPCAASGRRAQAVARRGRDAGGHRLSPAGDPRRDRGDPRRRPGTGTLDRLMEAGWVRPKGRREAPGRPLNWVTTPAFLAHFGLDSLKELPGTRGTARRRPARPRPGRRSPTNLPRARKSRAGSRGARRPDAARVARRPICRSERLLTLSRRLRMPPMLRFIPQRTNPHWPAVSGPTDVF